MIARRNFFRSAGTGVVLSTALLLAGCADDSTGGGASGGAGDGDGDEWKPDSQITIISAFGAGGGTDKVARAMLGGIEECEEGVSGNVEYREGGSGVVGYSHLQQQEGDDNVIMASTTELTTLPMFVETPFTWKDFTAIAQIADDQVSIAVPGDSPFQTLEDLVAEAQSRTVTVGVVGISGPDNIVKVLLEEQGDFKFETVIFEGGGETTAALLGGDIDAALGGAGDIAGQVESGDIRALAIFGEDRYESGAMAEVPTASEEGYDVSFSQWRGLLGPPGMSDEARDFYADCLEQWTETDSYDEYIETSLALPAWKGSEDFEQFLADQEKLISETLDK